MSGLTSSEIMKIVDRYKLTEELLSLPSASRALLAEKLAESLELDIA